MAKKSKRKNAQAKRNKATSVNSEDAQLAGGPTKSAKNSPKAKKTGAGERRLPAWNRRTLIKMLIAVPVAGAAGAAIHRYDVQQRGLHDLTSIGSGQPVVVQVHDPACQLCRRLMNNTREALKTTDGVVYRVADITTNEGETFRKTHNGETVSLILFDAKGRKRGTIRGVSSVAELEAQFKKLIAS